jgi:hypothetical protein
MNWEAPGKRHLVPGRADSAAASQARHGWATGGLVAAEQR